MNAKLSSIAIALIAATSTAAFAADGAVVQNTEWVEFTQAPSVKSRAQVRAELEQAQAPAQTEYVEHPRIASGKTRAEVRAELAQAYAQGELERSEFVDFSQFASTRSREEVREEAIRAAQRARGSDASGG